MLIFSVKNYIVKIALIFVLFPLQPSEIKELLGSETPFCRVVLPNGSSNVVMLEPGGAIRQILHTCCSRQNLILSAYDIFVGEQRKVRQFLLGY